MYKLAEKRINQSKSHPETTESEILFSKSTGCYKVVLSNFMHIANQLGGGGGEVLGRAA